MDAEPTRRISRGRLVPVIAPVALVVLIGIVVLGGAVQLFGFRATGGTVEVDVRNMSPGAITLVTEEPGPYLFPNTGSHVIQPWHEGMCFAHLGLYNGHIRLTVSGSNVSTPVVYETTTLATPLEIGVQIDAAGLVQFGGTFPADKLPCEGGGY